MEIEAAAKRRLADEYDAAQERGEVVGAHDGARKRVPNGNAFATAADVGLSRKQIHEARQVRDAEGEDRCCIPHAAARYIARTAPRELSMSERAIAFVEEFVSENIHAEGYEPEGDHSQAEAFAAQCLASAKAEGITDAEMKDAFEDLTQFMAAAIKTANDDEVDRLASKDDSF